MHVHVRNARQQSVRHFSLEAEAGLFHLWRLESHGEKAETLSFASTAPDSAGGAQSRGERAIHQRIRILREDLMVVIIELFRNRLLPAQSVVVAIGGCVDLRNAGVEPVRIPRVPLKASRRRTEYAKPTRGAKLSRIEGTLAGIWPQRIGHQSFLGEGLQVISRAETDGEMAGGADCVLQEPGVFVGVGMARLMIRNSGCNSSAHRAHRRAAVSVQARLLRFEGERIHFNRIEDVLSAGLRREIVINPAEQSVAAELPGIASAFKADSFCDVQPVFVEFDAAKCWSVRSRQ